MNIAGACSLVAQAPGATGGSVQRQAPTAVPRPVRWRTDRPAGAPHDAGSGLPATVTAVTPLPTRTETDSFGPIEVPADALWGAQTERSRRFFAIGEQRMPPAIIHALAESSAPPPR